MHSTHTERFVVFQTQNEWLVTYGDCTQISYPTREEAETSAFNAADALASQGYAVSMLIMPDGPDATGQFPWSFQGVRLRSNRAKTLHLSWPRLEGRYSGL
jgi:hypothetical protein